MTILIKCPQCGLENWAMAVLSGICAWCGYDVNKDKKNERRETNNIGSIVQDKEGTEKVKHGSGL